MFVLAKNPAVLANARKERPFDTPHSLLQLVTQRSGREFCVTSPNNVTAAKETILKTHQNPQFTLLEETRGIFAQFTWMHLAGRKIAEEEHGQIAPRPPSAQDFAIGASDNHSGIDVGANYFM